MKHLAAYMLLVLSGKDKPSEEEIIKLMEEVGVSVNYESLKALLEKVDDMKVH